MTSFPRNQETRSRATYHQRRKGRMLAQRLVNGRKSLDTVSESAASREISRRRHESIQELTPHSINSDPDLMMVGISKAEGRGDLARFDAKWSDSSVSEVTSGCLKAYWPELWVGHQRNIDAEIQCRWCRKCRRNPRESNKPASPIDRKFSDPILRPIKQIKLSRCNRNGSQFRGSDPEDQLSGHIKGINRRPNPIHRFQYPMILVCNFQLWRP